MSDILTNKCVNIIKKYNPESAIKKISELNKINNDDKIGYDDALKIYNIYADKKFDYDFKKYANKERSYQQKVINSVNVAKRFVNKNG
jgi:hypothetical protein